MSEKTSEPEPITTLGPADAKATAEVQPAKRRRCGQPCKLTPAVQQKVCDAIRMGNFLTIAAKAAGISMDTLQRWRHLGEEGRQPFASFLVSLQEAETDCETRLVQIMYDAAPQDYRAARDMLQRRFKERWAPNFDRFDGAGVTFNILINLGPENETPPVEIETTAALPPPDEPRN
ncbi:hypothetical protein [Candidatus Binatus sp.]|uniref:hypothetical protein n=1 Tax=Candidatus Binatus sp. TaxID=2811406 RepID=UPI003CC638DA